MVSAFILHPPQLVSNKPGGVFRRMSLRSFPGTEKAASGLTTPTHISVSSAWLLLHQLHPPCFTLPAETVTHPLPPISWQFVKIKMDLTPEKLWLFDGSMKT